MTYTSLHGIYMYPGSFMPESTTRPLSGPAWEDVLASQPRDIGYFSADNWYAVRVEERTYKTFTAEDGEVRYILDSTRKIRSYVVGEKVHYTNIDPENGRYDILIGNIERNSTDGYGVKTRCGNWQIASDYDEVVNSNNA